MSGTDKGQAKVLLIQSVQAALRAGLDAVLEKYGDSLDRLADR